MEKRMEVTSALTLQQAVKMANQVEQVDMVRKKRSQANKHTEEIKQDRRGRKNYKLTILNRSQAQRVKGHNYYT